MHNQAVAAEQDDAVEPEEAVGFFSEELSILEEKVLGACDPQQTPPYIHLDKHHWEAFKKATPSRGRNAIAAITVAATLLALWMDAARLGNASIGDAQAVLSTLDIRDKNPERGLRNCEWLRLRGQSILLNPAQTSKAIEMARAYCEKRAPDFG